MIGILSGPTKNRRIKRIDELNDDELDDFYCIWVLFFAHIPFVVNHTFNATPAERLQQVTVMLSFNVYINYVLTNKAGYDASKMASHSNPSWQRNANGEVATVYIK